ncbi:MAG: YIEGIA family protein [Bacillaceae bacterium]
MNDFALPILVGVIIGTLARLSMLRTDYRQFPTYLSGKIIHVALGLIGAGLGAVAVPSILSKDYTAITFLTVAASQFRDVRNMERNTLSQLDSMELVKRGPTYIEGIAITFESRNYLAILASFVTTFSFIVIESIYSRYIGLGAAIVVGILCLMLAKKLMSGSKLKDIVHIKEMPLYFKDEGLYVEDIYIMNIGSKARQQDIMEHGLGFLLEPKNFNSSVTIGNLGQRQAILYDVSVSLGIFRDSGTPALVPLAKRDLANGKVGVFILPQRKDVKKAIEIIANVPVLENAIRLSNTQLSKAREEE